MWFEARKQERKLRTAMVDHKRRQERRRNFYERIRKDPTEFMQIHGRQCKIHLDPSIAQAAESSAILRPWQGDPQILIDRFDARSHLDIIDEYSSQDGASNATPASSEERKDDRRGNYERYRVLVVNEFEKVPEEKFLKQIYTAEFLGGLPQQEDKKKKQPEQKAAIAYTYEDSTGPTVPQAADEDPDEDDDDLDEDELAEELLQATERRLDVTTMSKDQWKEMNTLAINYGVTTGDFVKFMWEDHEEEQYLQQLKDLEQEKANLSGKQSRRERKLLREIHVRNRGRFDGTSGLFGGLIQRPRRLSSSAKSGSKESSDSDSDSNSETGNPNIKLGTGKLEYVTSIGGEDNSKVVVKKPTVQQRKKRTASASSSISSSSASRKRTRPHAKNGNESRSSKRSRSLDRSRSRDRYYRGFEHRRASPDRRRGYRRSPDVRRRRRSASSSSSSSSDDRRGRNRRPEPQSSKSSIPMAKTVTPVVGQRQDGFRNEQSGDSGSELTMLSVRSSMSDSEQERRQIENTKRRLKNTKRKVRSNTKREVARPEKSKEFASKAKTLSLRERMALQTQKALKKTVAKDKEEESKRKEEMLREQTEREEEMREMTNLIRQKEREKRDREVEEDILKAGERQRSIDRSSDNSNGGKGRRRSLSSSSIDSRDRRRRHRSRSRSRRKTRSRTRSRSRSRHGRGSTWRERSHERSRYDHRRRSNDWRRSRSRSRGDRADRSGGDRSAVSSSRKIVDY